MNFIPIDDARRAGPQSARIEESYIGERPRTAYVRHMNDSNRNERKRSVIQSSLNRDRSSVEPALEGVATRVAEAPRGLSKGARVEPRANSACDAATRVADEIRRFVRSSRTPPESAVIVIGILRKWRCN